MGESVTIRDVAAEANVSIATVSRVLNNIGSVKETTKERVYQAMTVVGYPLPEEQPAVQSGSKTILVMITNLGNMFTGREIDGIFSTAYYFGYDCVIYRQKSKMYFLEEMQSIAESVNACGILMSLPDVPAGIMNKLAEVCPVVQFSEYAENCDVPYVSVDDCAAGKMATNYLLKLGYRRIGIINGPKHFKYARERERGYIEALQEYGLEPDPSLNITLPISHFNAARSAIDQMVNSPNPPEAVFAVSDALAAMVIKSFSMAGRSVPKDIAVISCEDTELAQYVMPSLTSVSQPIFHIGEQACSMLVDMLQGHRVSPSQICLNVELVIRGST